MAKDAIFDDSEQLTPTDILELEDEQGNVVEFALLAMVDVKGRPYAMTVPLAQLKDPNPNASIDLHLLAYFEEGDDVFYEDIEDEAEYAEVHAVCSGLLNL